MRKLLIITLLASALVTAQNGDNSPRKAFPSAYGGASTTDGGYGGILVIVNTLNSSTSLTGPLTNAQGETYYTGGIRAALSQNIGARYIVFNVSGNIEITSDMMVSRDDITVFGQSAPEGGITIHGDNIQFSGVDDQIWRYVRSRNGSTNNYDGSGQIGDDQSTYAFKVNGGDNVIFDHVTATWGGDKSILMGTNQDVSQSGHTVQRSILSNSHTYMQMSMQNPANFVQRDHISCIMNVFMRGENRTPNIGGTGGYVEVVGNVVQTRGTKYGVIQWSDNAWVNWTDNYYRIPSSGYDRNEFQRSNGSYCEGEFADDCPYTLLRLYSQRNIFVTNSTTVLDGTETGKDSNAGIWFYRLGGVNNDTPIDTGLLVASPHTGQIPNPVSITGLEAWETLIEDKNVGACHYLDNDGYPQYYMDPLDNDGLVDLANGVMKRSGNVNDWVLPTIPSNTRPGGYDTDNDGMADAWEIREFGNLSQGYGGDYDSDGYSNIEEYMNQVDFVFNTAGSGETPDPIAVTSLQWLDDDQTVNIGGFLDLSLVWTPSNASDKGFSLVSSNTSVVSNTGAVIGAGTATLTITADDDTNGTISDVMNVTVNDEVEPEPTPTTGRVEKGKFVLINN